MPDFEIISDDPDIVIVRETPAPRVVESTQTPQIVQSTQDPAPRVVQSTQTRTITKSTPGGRGSKGDKGDQGIQGERGEPGLSVVDPSLTSFTHVQVAVAADWPISHNLGFHPNVFPFDSAGSSVEGEVEHMDVNNLVLHFTSAFAGGAYLS